MGKTEDDNRKGRVFIRTFGCQMNDADSERLMARLQKSGYQAVCQPHQAEIVIVNTCCVRQHAQQRALGYLSSLKHLKNQGTVFCLIGCLASMLGKKLLVDYPFLDIVCSPHRLPEFLEFLRKAEEGSKCVATGESRNPFLEDLPESGGEVTASVPITKGCNNFCSYCVVPMTRGRLVSRPMEKIVAEVKKLTEQGVREITLLGQNVNQYGQDLPDRSNFLDLLYRVHEVSSVARIRFLTSHPRDVPERLVDVFKNLPKLYRHFHLPLQSGCDRILAAMNRGYTLFKYLDLVDRIRSVTPEISLSSDIMVGFPLEGEKEFRQTYNAVAKIGFNELFVFLYSARPDTAIFSLGDPVPYPVKKQRHAAIYGLQQLISREKLAFLEKKEVQAFVIRASQKKGYLVARTDFDQVVIIPGEKKLVGRIIKVRIITAGQNLLFGFPHYENSLTGVC